MVERWIILTHSIATGVYTRFATFEKWLNESAPATQFALNALEKHLSCCFMARYYEYTLFFSNTTVEMCSCVITQWVLYTNRPDSIGSLYSFEWNCIASTHSYSHWNIYLYIYYLVNGWFWKALVCYSKFINSHNNLSCMSWNSNNKLSKRKIFVGAFKEVLHINIVHE